MIKPAGAPKHVVGPLAISKTLVEAAKNKTQVTIWDEGGKETNVSVTKQDLLNLQKDLLDFRNKYEKEDLQHFRAPMVGVSAKFKMGDFSPLDMNIMRTYLDNNVKTVE